MALATFFRALNNVRVTIDPGGAGITDSQTTITLDTGDGASVPSALAPILMTIFDALDTDIFEIIQVDSVAGDVLTVQRGQQGTGALAWAAGTQIDQRNPAAEVNQYADALTDGNEELKFDLLSLTTSLNIGGGVASGGSDFLADGTINAAGDLSLGVAGANDPAINFIATNSAALQWLEDETMLNLTGGAFTVGTPQGFSGVAADAIFANATGGRVWIYRQASPIVLDDILGELLFDGFDGFSATVDSSAMLRALATQAHSGTNKGGELQVLTKPNGTDPDEVAVLAATFGQDQSLAVVGSIDAQAGTFGNSLAGLAFTIASGEYNFSGGPVVVTSILDGTGFTLAGAAGVSPTFLFTADTDADIAQLRFEDSDDLGTSKGGILIDRVAAIISGSAQNDIVVHATGSNSLHLATSLTVGITIDSSQNVAIPNGNLDVIGSIFAGSATSYGRLGQNLETNTTANFGGAAFNTWSATAAENPLLEMNRSKSATPGVYTTVALDDVLGTISWRGSDGDDFTNAATISVAVDNTVANEQIPSRMLFKTATAAGALTTAMRIDSFQVVEVQGVTGNTLRMRRVDVDISAGDVLGTFEFTGDDASALNTPGASILGVADGTWSSGDTPGRVEIYTTPAASEAPLLGLTVNKAQDTILEGVLFFKEEVTPTPVSGYGAIYSKTDNGLYFQDGAGAEHILHNEALSSLWCNAQTTASITVTISTQNAFTLMTCFENVGPEDDLGNLTGNTSTNLITVGANAAGLFDFDYHASITAAGGASKEMIIAIGITLATPLDITDADDSGGADPITITSTAHGLLDGDMVRIAGITDKTEANGDFIVTSVTANTFDLRNLDGTTTTNANDYNEGSPTGDVTIIFSGSTATIRELSNADVGVVANGGNFELEAGDLIGIYVANRDDTANLEISSARFLASRYAD